MKNLGESQQKNNTHTTLFVILKMKAEHMTVNVPKMSATAKSKPKALSKSHLILWIASKIIAFVSNVFFFFLGSIVCGSLKEKVGRGKGAAVFRFQ